MVKYQFFVGSTYKDLVDERQVAINAIIETNNIVAGMEFFGAVGENQLEHIKQEIDQTDYYLLIIGGRYGSLTKSGISYTEEEYDYAVLNGVRVIAFIHSNPESLAYNKSETNSSNREKLENFKTKVQNSGLVCFWDNLNDLKSKIVTTIYNVITLYSRRLSDHINILAKAGFAVERVIEETDRKTLDNDYALVHDFTHLIKPKNFLNQLFLNEEIVNEIYEHNFNARVQFSLKKRLEIPFIPPLQTGAERKSRSVSFHIRAKNFG